MRVNIKGIHRVRKTLADGSKRTYLYAWRGGPLLRDADGAPLQPGEDDNAIAEAYTRAAEAQRATPTETLDTLIDEFTRSTEYTSTGEKSRRAYDRYIADLRAYKVQRKPLVDMPLDAIQRPAARGIFKAWRDTMADRPRTADYAWTTIARILSVAKDRGRIGVNVCERGGRLYKVNRTEAVWTDDDIDALMSVASPSIQMALQMAVWTGQRQADLLRAPWSAYDGKRLRVRQGKTGARVSIPVGEPLRILLDASPRRSTTILTNSRGKSWTEDGFRTSWGKAVALTDIEGLTFHDLRGTAVTRLALAGCTNAQIASITGHSLRDVDAILDAHYLGGREKLAEQAMIKLVASRSVK